MDTETMIRELERVEEKHKHDKVFTGQLDVVKMAHDTRKRLEELSNNFDVRKMAARIEDDNKEDYYKVVR